jgi:hypothetical protein
MKRRKFLKSSALTTTAIAATVSRPASSFFNLGLIPRSSQSGAYSIDYGALFDGTSGFLSWTPSEAATSNTVGTLSVWVKRVKLGTWWALLNGEVSAGTNYTHLSFSSSDKLNIQEVDPGPTSVYHNSGLAIHRDPAAWMHVCIGWNSNAVSATDRIRYQVNGFEYGYDGEDVPSGRAMQMLQQSVLQLIGRGDFGSGVTYLPAILADYIAVDGTQYQASDFGEFDLQTGEWVPKKFAGTYGANGFYLDFSDDSGANTLGLDRSGNGNNWTVNGGISQVGLVERNYPTLNPLDKSSGISLSNGNLVANSNGTSAWYGVRSTMCIPHGVNSYWEAKCLTNIRSYLLIVDGNATIWENSATTDYAWRLTTDNFLYYQNTNVGATYSAVAVNDIVAMSVSSVGEVKCYKNNVLVHTFSQTLDPEKTYFVGVGLNDATSTESIELNFGQNGFTYTPPSGFSSISALSLPGPPIKKPSEHFGAVLYTGNGTSQSITGLDFKPDLVWLKRRDSTANHNLGDVVRGSGQNIKSDATTVESTEVNGLQSFDSNGFSVGTAGDYNASSGKYVAWCWKAGGPAVINNDGSIQTQVSANQTAGFSILTYTGNNTANATVGHGLSLPPEMIILKNLDTANSWPVFHKNLSAGKRLDLDNTNAEFTSANIIQNCTATTFELSSNGNVINSVDRYVAYCWHSVEGYSKFGSYNGNSLDDGPFVYLGFKPVYLLIKDTTTTDAAQDWFVFDSARYSFNGTTVASGSPGGVIRLNEGTAEVTHSSAFGDDPAIDFVSSGFKIRTNSGTVNSSSRTYIYAAFAEIPLKYARAR